MSVGIVVPLPAYTIDPAFIAQKAEELGFESIWYHEHPILPVSSASPFPSTGGAIPETYRHFTDPYIALARASAVTSKIKLCTGITLVPERNPLLLAKEIAALDRYSGGRFVFGIGAGWNREETTIMGGISTTGGRKPVKRLWHSKSCGPRMRRSFMAGITIFLPFTAIPNRRRSPTRRFYWAEMLQTYCDE